MRPLLLLALAIAALTAAQTDPPPVVFVPYERLDAIALGARSVWLPYDRFITLWESAQRDLERGAPTIDAALDEVTFTGAVTGDTAELAVAGTATCLADGWAIVDLPAGLALTRFAAQDERVVLERTDAAVRLHLPARGHYRFTATVVAPVAHDAAGRRTLVLPVPRAGAARLDLALNARDAQPTIAPPVAMSRSDDEHGTRIAAVLGGAGEVTIAWQPAATGVGGEAVLIATEDARLVAGERALRVDAAIDLRILRRPLAGAAIAIPDGYQVLAVDAPGLAAWTVADGRLELRPQAPVEDRWSVAVRLERVLPQLGDGETRRVELALPAVVGAAKTTGVLAIDAGDGVTATLTRSDGLVQMDPAELPEALRSGATAAYRFLAAPPALALAVARLMPEVRVDLHELVRLGAEEDSAIATVALDVRNAGIFAIELSTPARWDVVDVAGLALDEVQAPTLDGERRHWRLALRSRLIGAATATVRLRAAASIPRDASPRDGIALAPLVVEGARRETVALALAAPTSWAVTSSDRRGLSVVDSGTGVVAVGTSELHPDEAVALAFSGIDARAASLVLALRPRSRELALAQEDLLTLADGGWRRVVTWRGEVRYAAATTVRVRAPTAFDDRIQFRAALAEHAAVAHDATTGMTTWELRFQNPVIGALTLGAEIAGELPPLPPDTPVRFAAPPITLEEPPRLGVVQAVARRGALEVTASSDGLAALAATDVPAGMQSEGIIAAFHGAAPAPLVATVTRHDLMPLVDASVASATYVAVVAEDGILRVKGRLDLVDRGRPYLALRLPVGATLLELAVAGRQARPSRRPEDGSILVRLDDPTARQGVAFVYEQRIAPRLGAGGRVAVALPTIADATPPVPVERTDLQLWLPQAATALAIGGDLQRTDEFPLPGDGDGLSIRFTPSGRPAWLQRVGEGGSVRIVYLHDAWLRVAAILAALAAGAGVLALRRRAIAVAALLIATLVAWLLVTGPASAIADAAFAGAVAVAAGALAWRGARLLLDARRRARLADLPPLADPWLEPPAAPPADGPASTPPGGAS